MISVLTPGGDKTIGAVSALTPGGAIDIANISLLTPGGDVSLWSAAGGGGGFTVTNSPSPAFGAVAYAGATTIDTQECAATPSGGLAPFTYAWARIAGSASFSAISPNSQATSFRCVNVPAGATFTATFEVTVTDARGRTATATVDAEATNYGDLSGPSA